MAFNPYGSDEQSIFDPFGGQQALNMDLQSGFAAPAGGLPPMVFPMIPPTSLPVPPEQVAQPVQTQQAGSGFLPTPTPPPAGVPSGIQTQNAPAATNYAPMFGWEGSKLNDPTADSLKYQFGRFVQDRGYTPQQWRGNMQGLVNEFNAATGANISVADGSDMINFGYDVPIDVIFGAGPETEADDVWGWIPTYGPPPPAAAAPPPNEPQYRIDDGPVGNQVPSWLTDLINSLSPAGPALPGGLSPDQSPYPFDDQFDVDPGQDPFSQLINSALGGVLQTGGTPYGADVANALGGIISGGGLTPDIGNRLISAREDAGTLFEGLLNDARGSLADMGQLSVPGVEQGGTNRALDRITGTVGKELGRTVRDIETEALTQSSDNVMTALQLATGMSSDMAKNILAAAGSGTQRQQVLSQIALQSLGQNMEWQQFLAQYGLDHARLAEEIQQGRLQMIIPLLQLFLRGAEQAAGGYID